MMYNEPQKVVPEFQFWHVLTPGISKMAPAMAHEIGQSFHGDDFLRDLLSWCVSKCKYSIGMYM